MKASLFCWQLNERALSRLRVLTGDCYRRLKASSTPLHRRRLTRPNRGSAPSGSRRKTTTPTPRNALDPTLRWEQTAPLAKRPSVNVRGLLEEWGRLWSIPDLSASLTIHPSRRLRRSLGLCNPHTGRISIQADLPLELFREVLCHEAAHYAAHRLHGRVAAHGPEWRRLVQRAGYAPTPRLGPSAPPRPSRARYLHTCPVCQMRREARRPVPGWTCRACVESGLDGRLTIERLA